MNSTLDFLYIVLAIGLIPIFVLTSMVLWKLYKTLNHADRVLTFAESILEMIERIQQVPSLVMNQIISNFFPKKKHQESDY